MNLLFLKLKQYFLGIGLVLFLIEIALLIWLKFQSIYPSYAAQSGTGTTSSVPTNQSKSDDC